MAESRDKNEEVKAMTQSAEWFLGAGEKILAGMGAQTNDAFTQYLEQNGLSEGFDVQFIQLANGFAPEPIAPSFFVKRAPYTNPAWVKEQVQATAERGFLEPAGEGHYRLTPKGKESAEGLYVLADRLYSGVAALSVADLARLTSLLGRVVKAARELPEPAEKWALEWGKVLDRGTAAPPIMQFRRKLLDLFGFRDDVHIAAWQPHETDGQVWETFTYVWRGDAGSSQELAEKLPYRNYSEDAYASALQTLASRGWIVEQDGQYIATEAGQQLRQQVEDRTNAYFDAAWTVLDESEVQDLRDLMGRMAEAVQPAEQNTA
jgi:hypothetical protein